MTDKKPIDLAERIEWIYSRTRYDRDAIIRVLKADYQIRRLRDFPPESFEMLVDRTKVQRRMQKGCLQQRDKYSVNDLNTTTPTMDFS